MNILEKNNRVIFLQNIYVKQFSDQGPAQYGMKRQISWDCMLKLRIILLGLSASVNKAIIGSDNGLSHIRLHTIISTNVDLISIGPLGTNLSEIGIKIQQSSFTKIILKMSAIGQPFWFDFIVLTPDYMNNIFRIFFVERYR